VYGNEIANRLAKDGFVQKSVGPELSLGISTKNIKKKINHLADNQHLAM